MSWVTDVLLCINLEERLDEHFNFSESCKPIDSINAWLDEHDQGRLDELSEHVSSGGKAMQSFVYGGAFNYLKNDEFVKTVFSQPWKMPRSVSTAAQTGKRGCLCTPGPG